MGKYREAISACKGFTFARGRRKDDEETLIYLDGLIQECQEKIKIEEE